MKLSENDLHDLLSKMNSSAADGQAEGAKNSANAAVDRRFGDRSRRRGKQFLFA